MGGWEMAGSVMSDTISNMLASYAQSGIERVASYCFGAAPAAIPELKNLKLTMNMIQARLSDAEKRGEAEDGHRIKLWLKHLKRIVYQLEDLLEEAAAVADPPNNLPLGGKPPKRSRTWSSWSDSSTSMPNNKLASKAEDIVNQLRALISTMKALNFRQDSPGEDKKRGSGFASSRSDDTHSFVIQGKVIGRDEEKDNLVKMVLDLGHDDGRKTVSVIPIVGIGGLGKTALAKLVFNDGNVKTHFEMRHWVCISVSSSLKDIVSKILQSMSGDVCHNLSMELLEQLQTRLREAVDGKRFLLVLDDVVDESKAVWDDLMDLLGCGKQGSKIIVTSRSKVVAQNVGTVGPCELKGLPEDKSWELFRRLAFKEGDDKSKLVRERIGREIVRKCANVPLVIKAIACLLHYMDETEWEYFEQTDLRYIKPNEESSILLTLKLSYDRLPSKLKPCFTYCSVFPKNHVFSKDDLIHLWMAQGFLGSDKKPEHLGHMYFMQLLRRCFFQDVVKDSYGEIISCKMHDLIHELAQQVADGETLLVDGSAPEISDNLWHVSFAVGSSEEDLSRLLHIKLMRSLLLLSCPVTAYVDKVFLSFTCLRALDLRECSCETLPNSLLELLHLRYLRLGSSIKSLPECITGLRYLQTLDVQECDQLEKFPERFSKLINLRHLYYGGKDWVDLPPEFGRLSSLQRLDKFIVGKSNRLDALASLKNLAGHLIICIATHYENPKEGILRDKKLSSLNILRSSSCKESIVGAESALSSLQPPESLKMLRIQNWEGISFPSWGMNEFASFLPYLVSVEIDDCSNCRNLPPFSQLPYLESLCLRGLQALDYIEIGQSNNQASPTTSAYFPSLKTLEMRNLFRLKYWSREEKYDIYHQRVLQQPSFPCLSKLMIERCSELKSMPLTPTLESLEANSIHEKLLRRILYADEELPATSSPSSSLSTLRSMTIRSIQQLKLLSINLCSLKDLKIERCTELTNLIVHPPTDLRQLNITACGRLRDISLALLHLSALEELDIEDCEELVLGDIKCDNVDPNVMTGNRNVGMISESWKGLERLRSLKLSRIPNLDSVSLRGVASVSTLCDLSIVNCPQLTAIPPSFRELTSLQKLRIKGCPEQERRCYKADGEDWPHIEHIPYIHLGCPSSLSYIGYGPSGERLGW